MNKNHQLILQRLLLFLVLTATPFPMRAAPLDEWTLRFPQGHTPVAVAFGMNQYVAVAAGGTILTSPDFVHWTPRNTRIERLLHSIAYGNGRFVAVGRSAPIAASQGLLLSSPDGIHWTAYEVTDELRAVEYLNGIFVATGGTGVIWTSSDGLAWRQHLGEQSPLLGVAYGSGRFVIVGGRPDVGVITTSTNGLKWARQNDITRDAIWGIA